MYACLQYFWTYVISFYFKKTGTLAKITSPLGFIPAFISNLIVAIPMIVVFVGTVIRYKRDFDDKMMYIKTDRYLLNLFPVASPCHKIGCHSKKRGLCLDLLPCIHFIS